MRIRMSFPVLTALLSTAMLSAPAPAGQVRVDVAVDGALSFTPQNSMLNRGDHVIWYWDLGGTHAVTQGSNCVVGAPLFDSGFQTDLYSWKSDRSGTISYFCPEHCADGMTGTLTVVESGVPVADFRITEVRRSNEHTDDFIEITNLGGAPGDLDRFRLTSVPNQRYSVGSGHIIVPTNGSVVVHPGFTGTNTQTDLYLPELSLAALGSLALLDPGLTSPSTATMLDFVEWGGAGRENEDVAFAAGLWSAGSFLPVIPAGHSIEFCGEATSRGISYWRDNPEPSPGTHPCLTPVEPTTWGAIKARRP